MTETKEGARRGKGDMTVTIRGTQNYLKELQLIVSEITEDATFLKKKMPLR